MYIASNVVDVDECLVNSAICGGGTCENTEGSYMCQCFDGYELTNTPMLTCIGNVNSRKYWKGARNILPHDF